MPAPRAVLDFISWGELMRLRAEMALDGTWPVVEDQGREMVVALPGEVEPANEVDQYLPEYVGLLDAQLYWPGSPPKSETIARIA